MKNKMDHESKFMDGTEERNSWIRAVMTLYNLPTGNDDQNDRHNCHKGCNAMLSVGERFYM